jgi:hypothetical protein
MRNFRALKMIAAAIFTALCIFMVVAAGDEKF